MAKQSIQAANATRAQKAKALHEKKTQERASNQATIKAAYLADSSNVLLLDILAKSKSFIQYHTKLAQDGVGARKTGHLLENGTSEVENYFFSNEEIASEMKKASGIQEIVDYIERQLTVPETPKKKKIVS